MTLWNRLNEIQADVLGRFTYVCDCDNPLEFNRVEYWQDVEHLNGAIHGDCEDFALACRKLCREKKISTRLVYCYTEKNAGHLVLESDGWILDCRQKEPVARDDLPYKWVRISGYETGDPWHEIKE